MIQRFRIIPLHNQFKDNINVNDFNLAELVLIIDDCVKDIKNLKLYTERILKFMHGKVT